MKEAPEKIWLGKSTQNLMLFDPNSNTYAEYTRTDVFIEKACKKLEKCMYDNLMFQGRLHRKEVIETFIENFRKYLKGE